LQSGSFPKHLAENSKKTTFKVYLFCHKPHAIDYMMQSNRQQMIW